MQHRHHLKTTPSTCHWGFFDGAREPVLQVRSGERVVIDTVSGGPEVQPGSGFAILPEMAAIHANTERALGPHILTGPIAVEGARPGHVLEVRIHDIRLRQDWGYMLIRPLLGTLPQHFDQERTVHIPIDRERRMASLPWGGELRLHPFLGVMGVAPPRHWQRITSLVPRLHGGNLDNKELVAGTVLYLPVLVDGALFSCGDGHAAQGDGEVCLTAIETALQAELEFVLRDDLSIDFPRAETPTHLVTMATGPDLDLCAEQALVRMIALLGETAGLVPEDAYMLCSIAGDLHITQTVNQHKGVHMMLGKHALPVRV
ncbi:acetamidase/formamidase family protein [Nitratireductor soli]|uniref:acetamidase/formamidase family protein n=1 Tax=Nitratireductor soli TaxID=1670619 RepID=UPI00065E5EB0|nr:acetamidase/formamidase family protein [Nitratireductor soli]